MIKLSQERTKELLAIHGWSGILLGLLLYAVICTGTIAVFSTEIGNWSNPLDEPATDSLPANITPLVHELGADVDPAHRETFFLYTSGGGRLMLQFEGHLESEDEDGHPGAEEHYGVLYEIDPNTLTVLNRTEGPEALLDAARRTTDALADFFVDLHVRLHIPNPWGLFVTGVLGLIMMVAAMTGFVVHRHLIRELFTIRRNKEALLRSRDAHVIAGTWTLPFAFVLAFTGSFFSFATSLGLPAMAMVVFGGDQERAIAEVFGEPPATDDTPAQVADFDAVIADAQARTGARPNFVAGRFYGRADSQLVVFTPAVEGSLTGRSPVYSGVTGEFLYDKPILVGQQPSAGNTVAALMGPLHFGNFSGVTSKAVWFALGFAGAYVALTGMLLWTNRRAEQRAWQRMSRLVHWVGYGLPLAMALTPYGTFAGRWFGWAIEAAQWTAFGLAALAALAIAMLARSVAQVRAILVATTGFTLLGVPLTRLLGGGPGWVEAWSGGLTTVVAGDIAIIAGGIICLGLWRYGAGTSAVETGRASAAAREAAA